MTWSVVAWKDFRDSVRSKSIWVLSVLFVLVIAGSVYVVSLLLGEGPVGLSSSSYVRLMSGGGVWVLTAFVALIGLLTSYPSVVGERESGSLKLLLGLPHSRSDVVLGKVVGRSGVVSVSVLAGFVVGLLVLFVFYDSVDFLGYLVFALLTAVLGVAWVCIGVGLSAGFGSGRAVRALTFGLFFVSKFLWDTGLGPRALVGLVEGFENMFGSPPPWYDFVRVVSPNEAYSVLSSGLTDGPIESLQLFSGAVLLFWVVLPPVLGYARFRRMDLS